MNDDDVGVGTVSSQNTEQDLRGEHRAGHESIASDYDTHVHIIVAMQALDKLRPWPIPRAAIEIIFDQSRRITLDQATCTAVWSPESGLNAISATKLNTTTTMGKA